MSTRRERSRVKRKHADNDESHAWWWRRDLRLRQQVDQEMAEYEPAVAAEDGMIWIETTDVHGSGHTSPKGFWVDEETWNRATQRCGSGSLSSNPGQGPRPDSDEQRADGGAAARSNESLQCVEKGLDSAVKAKSTPSSLSTTIDDSDFDAPVDTDVDDKDGSECTKALLERVFSQCETDIPPLQDRCLNVAVPALPEPAVRVPECADHDAGKSSANIHSPPRSQRPAKPHEPWQPYIAEVLVPTKLFDCHFHDENTPPQREGARPETQSPSSDTSSLTEEEMSLFDQEEGEPVLTRDEQPTGSLDVECAQSGSCVDETTTCVESDSEQERACSATDTANGNSTVSAATNNGMFGSNGDGLDVTFPEQMSRDSFAVDVDVPTESSAEPQAPDPHLCLNSGTHQNPHPSKFPLMGDVFFGLHDDMSSGDEDEQRRVGLGFFLHSSNWLLPTYEDTDTESDDVTSEQEESGSVLHPLHYYFGLASHDGESQRAAATGIMSCMNPRKWLLADTTTADVQDQDEILDVMFGQ
jgi:hypothetical protein